MYNNYLCKMTYVITLKGPVNKLVFDAKTNKSFYDLGMEYFKISIEAENETEMRKQLQPITQSGTFKEIGIDY